MNEVLGGYSDVARHLTRLFRTDDETPVSRQQVEAWNKRRTVNRAGQMFPSPEREVPHAAAHRPRLLFSLARAADWYRGGAPGKYGRSWRE